jgi:uncharacterized membrane protein YccC
MDWSKVFEVSLGAFLAFVFGFVLQIWLVRRQERFQKQLLERQLSFMEKLERDRAANDEKVDKARVAATAAIIGHHNSVLKQISLDERNHESRERTRDRFELRDTHRNK